MSSVRITGPSSIRDTNHPFANPHEEALLTLMRSADCLHRSLQKLLKPYGLTATQYNVLRILRRSRPTGLTCSSIGSRMITPEPDITRLLNRLKTLGFVRQQRDAADRRVVWTHITDVGLNSLEKLGDVMDAAPKKLLRSLSREELRHLTALLSKAACCSEETSQPEAIFGSESGPAAIAKPPSPRSVRSSLPRHPLE